MGKTNKAFHGGSYEYFLEEHNVKKCECILGTFSILHTSSRLISSFEKVSPGILPLSE